MLSEKEKLLKRTYAQLRVLERRRKSKIFIYVENEQDHMCYPQRNFIFNKKPEFRNVDKLEILLHSGGGHAEYAYQLSKLFRRYCKQLNIIVPYFAKSAATLMCLAADVVYMGERAELGPLDVQITDPFEKGLDSFSPINEFKSMEFLRDYAIEMLEYYSIALVERAGMSVKEAFHEAMPAVASTMSPLYAKIDPSKIGSYRRSLAVAEEYAKRLLNGRKVANADGIAEKLVWKYPSHDFLIDRAEAKELGLPIVYLDVNQDDAFVEIVRNILRTGESIYAFTKADEKKRKTTTTTRKKQAASKKPASTAGGATKLKAA
jgi:hypothetical protein